MAKTSRILKVLANIFSFFYELIKYPRLFFLRRLIWKKYRKGHFPNKITCYELENEEILTRHYLTTWHLNPSLEKLESDIASIMALKQIRYNAIRVNKIEHSDYDVIVKSLKSGSRKIWEYIIEILDQMTHHFPEIKEFTLRMIKDKNGFVRETALLIMEDGNFNFEERKNIYGQLKNDRNKKVRERVLDMVFREGKAKKREFRDFLEQWKSEEQDESIKRALDWIYK